MKLWAMLYVVLVGIGMMNGCCAMKRKARSLIGLTNGGRINIGVQFILPLTISLPMVSGNNGKRRRHIESPLPGDQEYDIDRWHGPHLRKLDFYFQQLNIHDEACREKILCEMAADPTIYHPLSELLLAKLNNDEFSTSLERMRKYETAVMVGDSGNKTCSSRYEFCPDDPSELLNLPMLRAWQMVDQFFHIHLYEEMDW